MQVLFRVIYLPEWLHFLTYQKRCGSYYYNMFTVNSYVTDLFSFTYFCSSVTCLHKIFTMRIKNKLCT